MPKIEGLSMSEAQAKRKELVKDLLTAKLSLDPTTVSAPGGLPGLQRALRATNQRIAQLKQTRA